MLSTRFEPFCFQANWTSVKPLSHLLLLFISFIQIRYIQIEVCVFTQGSQIRFLHPHPLPILEPPWSYIACIKKIRDIKIVHTSCVHSKLAQIKVVEIVPEMERAHLWLQVIPWCVRGGTSLAKELSFSLPGKFLQRPNKLKLCWKIPCPLASYRPMLTKKNICKKKKKELLSVRWMTIWKIISMYVTILHPCLTKFYKRLWV